MKSVSVQNILVPIDFSKISTRALETAKRLAQRLGATVHLAHVHKFDHLARLMAPTSPLIPFSAVTFEQDAEAGLTRQLKALANKEGLSSTPCHFLRGAPVFDEICRLAPEIPVDLIVTPTHGRTGLKHVFLGSTAERIVQHSPCPVFVVREKKRPSKTRPRLSINTILVPVDFSSCSRAGVQYAIEFANEFGARIILLHATYLGYIYTIEGAALYDVRALQEAAKQNAERQMQKLVRAVKFGSVNFETVFTNGSPVVDICAFAKDHDVDLIITSTHGLTGLEHVLIGSIAEQMVRHAPCSVLVVPSHPKTRVAKLTRRVGRTRKTRLPIINTGAPKHLTDREGSIRKYRKLAKDPDESEKCEELLR